MKEENYSRFSNFKRVILKLILQCGGFIKSSLSFPTMVYHFRHFLTNRLFRESLFRKRALGNFEEKNHLKIGLSDESSPMIL